MIRYNTEEVLVEKLNNFLSLFSYLSDNICVLDGYEITNGHHYEIKTTAAKLNSEFKVNKHNETFIWLKSKNNNDKNYFIQIKSILSCFMPKPIPIESISPHHEHGNNTIIDFFDNYEIQSIIYVIAILSLFTVIFALVNFKIMKFNVFFKYTSNIITILDFITVLSF